MPTSKTIAKRVASREAQAAKQALQKHLLHRDQDLVSNGATLKCSLGTAPSKLVVEASATYDQSEGQWLATIMQHKPNKNIKPFGSCKRVIPPPPCGLLHHHNGRRLNQPEWLDPIPFLYWLTGATLKCKHRAQ